MIKLNESANCPSLEWKREIDPKYPEDYCWFAWSERVNGEEHLFKVKTVYYSEDEEPEEKSTTVMVLYDGWGDQCLEVEVETDEEGKAMCEKLWESIYAVSEYLKVDYNTIHKIAEFQKWPGLH